jgi:hypothetical protein
LQLHAALFLRRFGDCLKSDILDPIREDSPHNGWPFRLPREFPETFSGISGKISYDCILSSLWPTGNRLWARPHLPR